MSRKEKIMKRKMVALMLSAMMAVSLMAGCSEDKAIAAEPKMEPATEPLDPLTMSDDELTEYLDGGDTDSDIISEALYNLESYRNISDKLNAVEIYDSENLTYDILTNRNGKTIVEKTYGVVLDEEGNGMQLNPSVAGQDYIKYHDLPVGSVVLSVFVYNPETNAEDDIISRSDFVLDTLD